MHAELDAIICSGARRDAQFTYGLLEERVPVTAQLERDEALLKLSLTYFSTRGPATAADFAWWSGLALADAKNGIELAAPSLSKEPATAAPSGLPRRPVAKVSAVCPSASQLR